MATLQIEKVSGATPSVRAYLVTGNWTSSTLTWNNRPGYNTAYESTLSGVQSNGTWYTMYVTDSVQSWTTGQNPNYGFLLKDTYESDPNHWTTFYSSDASSPHKPELHIFYDQNTPVSVNRFYSTYAQTAEYREYLQYNMNCYGYALHVYSLQGSAQNPYKQQPGEFANDGAGYGDLHDTYYQISLYSNMTGAAFLDFLEQKMEDDFSTISSTTGTTWILQPTTRTAAIPEGYRKIALTVRTEIYNYDYHFYLRHSDGTWSHKQGATPVTNLSPDTNVVITDSNIADVVTEYGYDDGVRYYLISKPAIIDYPHNFGQNESIYTSTAFKDRAGASLETSASFTGTSKLARFDYPNDIDCYVYTPSSSKNYTVTVSVVNAEIQIYNTYGICLANGEGQVTYPLLANHNYFIRIKYTTAGDYTVTCS